MAGMSPYRKIIPAIIYFLLCVIPGRLCYSQAIVKTVNPNETIFLVRTKQFNEFLDRFNYITDFNGNRVDSVFMSKIPREKMINSLFDLNDPRIDKSGNNYSNSFTDAKIKFVNDVVRNNLLIYKYSANIIAEAKSRVIYQGTPVTLSVFLSQEIVGKDMVKWVIDNVKGNLFTFLKSDTSMIRFISPSSNETDFINLRRALEDDDYLQYYASSDYSPDNLTLFFYMLNSGLVKFEYVQEIIYHIIDLPGWCINVKEFNRNEMNSGWLITDISRNSYNKKEYLENLD
jgi:hypothetical protein